MDRGYSVLVFPEGTRSRDGRLHSFRSGIGLLGQQSGVPIVPIALIGLGAILAEEGHRRRPRWFRSGKLAVHVGAAVPVEYGEEPSRLTETLEQRVRSLQSSGDNKS
jgi:long-chain acyl-CoA synthetase